MKSFGVARLVLLAAIGIRAQDTTGSGALSFTNSFTTLTGSSASKAIAGDGGVPTGSVTYLSVTSTRTLSTTRTPTASNGTEIVSTGTSTSVTLTLIGGGGSSANTTAQTATSTSSSAAPTNTQPCNGYPEFCTRKYSNITQVCAHNSPFSRKNNAASNQELGVTDQLNDGIRMLQGQSHYENNTLYLCHTTCDLLNAGTLEDYLSTVNEWVSQHPYDVVTILIRNGDVVDATKFVDPIQSSGLGRWVYVPPKVPMGLNDWPTLAEMILTQKRVVFFLDYNANQTAVPYILDEFSQLWETPFSPTNFESCSPQRPPKLSNKSARSRMYMANHNLNLEINIQGNDLLIPNTAALNQTNNVSGNGSLGAMATMCAAEWGRPPNFLLVDYYNHPNGTVFEVAAKMNNVTYTGRCCGTGQSAASHFLRSSSLIFTVIVFAFSSVLLTL